MHADGAPVDLELRADRIVARRRRRFVAEVKSGTRAPRIAHGPTRRQLLEYRLAFDVDGMLLVDPDRGIAHEVTFPPLPDRSRPAGAPWLIAGVAIGAVATWLLIR